jgi:hypothetical protein
MSSLPIFYSKNQGSDHRAHRVLKVGDQLDGQQGKGLSPCPAKKSGNGNPFLPESWKKVNRVPVIGGNLTITIAAVANGTNGAYIGEKINTAG